MARKKILWKRSGVYSITNLENNKRYVGSSKNLSVRKGYHLGALKNNKREHPFLQEAYNKYGKENFIFEVLEYCEKENLIEREQYWMDHYKSYKREFGYNSSITAGKVTHTEETKMKMSETRRGKNNRFNFTFSEESKKKMRESHLGKTLSEETKNKMGIARRGNKNALGYRHSEEAKIKISNYQKLNLTEEIRLKRKEKMLGNSYGKGVWEGKKHTKESKKKMSESAKLREEKKRLKRLGEE